jgi:hypothetical protein
MFSQCELHELDIEEWKRNLEGAEPDGWCNPGVRCEACGKAYQIKLVEIFKIRGASETRYHYVCLDCQWNVGLKW